MKLNGLDIDHVNIPYYGKEENHTIKTKPKQGTSRFFAYASIYTILRNKRYTLTEIYSKRRNFKRYSRLPIKRNRSYRV
jgi:putative transposase